MVREGVKPAVAGRTVSLDSASRFRERDGESLGGAGGEAPRGGYTPGEGVCGGERRLGETDFL